MDWLSQNWVWVVVAAGILAYLLQRNRMHHADRFGSMAGGTSRSGALGDQRGQSSIADTRAPAGYGTERASTPGTAIDPVTGTSVLISVALTSVHAGQVYYFASTESRARFEASPAQFVRGGENPQSPEQDHVPADRSHHRHGC